MKSDSVSPGPERPVQPSRVMLLIILLIGLLAAGGIVLSGLPLWLKAGTSVAVLIYGAWHLYRQARPVWRSLAVATDRAAIRYRSGEVFTITPGNGSFVSPLYIGFRCRSQSSERTLSVGFFRGQVDEGSFRRLAVFLRQSSRP